MMVLFFFVVFLEILLKFRDFVNSDDCIGKITSKSIILQIKQPVFIKKKLILPNIRFFLVKKMRNAGNCIYDYAHSFFGADF